MVRYNIVTCRLGYIWAFNVVDTIVKVFCFGGSTATGYMLDWDAGDKPFVEHFAESLQIPYVNYAEDGSSLGIVLQRLIAHHTEISKDDIVLVIVPPDVRWYDENEEQGFYSLSNYMKEEYYDKFLNNKTLEWFRYHHELFAYSIQKILDDIGCYYIMAHDYGDINEWKKYGLNIDFTKFLSDIDIQNLLSTTPQFYDMYPDHIEPREHQFMYDGPTSHDLESSYIMADNGHPNNLGHKKLAEIFLEKYKKDNT